MQRLWFFSIVAAIFILSCDSEPGLPTAHPSDNQLTALTLSPSLVTFNPSQTVKDTTVTVLISIRLRNGSSEIHPRLIVVRKSTEAIFFDAPMSTANPAKDQFSHSLQIPTSTTSVEEFAINVILIDKNQPVSNRVSGTLKITGFSTGRPVLLFQQTPATVIIPNSGNQAFDLKAKVSHPNGQNLIDRVNVIIRGANGVALTGSPFQLFDNGLVNESGDLAAGDSLFTRRFVISASNNPDTYTLKYYAIDRFGASSDTLTATMRFVP